MYSPSISINQTIVALAKFIRPFMPTNAGIVRAQANRVPMPPSPCAVLTEISQIDIETPTTTYVFPTGNTIYGPKQIDIQIDFYGDNAGDYCAAVKTVFRSPYATEQFPNGIKPLYCTDGMQMPLITGEQQYESRWSITASLQYNPAIVTPQESANEATVDQIINVDVEYPA